MNRVDIRAESGERRANLSHVDTAILDPGALPLSGRTAERRSGAGVSRILVRVVAAVVGAVAHHRVDDAARVVALEVVLTAVDLTATVRLVRSVLAVGRAVAEPRPRNAYRRPNYQVRHTHLISHQI